MRKMYPFFPSPPSSFLRLYLVSGNSVYLDHVQGFLRRKRIIRDWIYLEENIWARQLLPESLYTLLEFDTKISQGGFTKYVYNRPKTTLPSKSLVLNQRLGSTRGGSNIQGGLKMT